jgi:hypothetical protein
LLAWLVLSLLALLALRRRWMSDVAKVLWVFLVIAVPTWRGSLLDRTPRVDGRGRGINVAEISIHPLTPERWDDLLTLFGEHGAYSGCWCMWWRLTSAEFSKGNTANKAAFKQLVDDQTRTRPAGLLR